MHWTKNKVMAFALMTGSLFTVGCAGGYSSYGYASTPPPPLRTEYYGRPPGAGYVWIQGNWAYRGNNYVWTQGRWDRPPRGRREWRPGYWEHRGNRYQWRDGRWR